MKTFVEQLDILWEKAQTLIINKVRQNSDLIKVSNEELNFNLDDGRWLDSLTPMNIVDNSGYEYGYGVLSHEQITELADWVNTLEQSKSEPTVKDLDKIIGIIEEYHSIDEYTEDNELCGYEINTYTSGGVNQIIFLDFRRSEYDPKKALDFLKVLEERVESINIDEEITLNRNDPSYVTAFTLKESITDFEDWKDDLNKLIEKL